MAEVPQPLGSAPLAAVEVEVLQLPAQALGALTQLWSPVSQSRNRVLAVAIGAWFPAGAPKLNGAPTAAPSEAGADVGGTADGLTICDEEDGAERSGEHSRVVRLQLDLLIF